jgi:hypothetical protein
MCEQQKPDGRDMHALVVALQHGSHLGAFLSALKCVKYMPLKLLRVHKNMSNLLVTRKALRTLQNYV